VQDLQDTSLIHTHHFILHRSSSDLVELCREILAPRDAQRDDSKGEMREIS
jgi:hypothetical protein